MIQKQFKLDKITDNYVRYACTIRDSYEIFGVIWISKNLFPEQDVNKILANYNKITVFVSTNPIGNNCYRLSLNKSTKNYHRYITNKKQDGNIVIGDIYIDNTLISPVEFVYINYKYET